MSLLSLVGSWRLQRNADNDAADMSLLLESKTRQTLLMVQERTERERDEQRAACRRLREEANVRGCGAKKRMVYIKIGRKLAFVGDGIKPNFYMKCKQTIPEIWRGGCPVFL